ncbi:MFS transporter [Streptococcus didelphis]|uniref:MFS transporter n=1 Tax=Streptococcus didelphis TaxID=102886 RepID=UPI000368FB66|nr:MFS transporter [Streptococcus didelphis]
MKAFFEKISLLSLSLMMISPFSVSPAIPKMIAFYQAQGHPASQVDILFSLSSFAVLAMLLLNPMISSFLSEKAIIILGLLLIGIGGALPVFIQSYPLVFLSRIILGLGIGLINAKAINIISERFTGKERIKMLGYRASTEVLGASLFTFISGYLIVFGWTQAFMIYLLALIILVLYLLFVPDMPHPSSKDQAELVADQKNKSLTREQLKLIIGLALYAGFVILINTSNTLRIPLVVDHLGIGSARDASFILALMMLMGILAGFTFSRLLEIFKVYLMAAVVIALGLGMLILWQAQSLVSVGLGALITGFVYSIGVTLAFNTISEKFPSHQLTKATTLVLIGCNVGGAAAAFVLQLIAHWFDSLIAAYVIYSIISLLLGLSLFLRVILKRKKHQG